MKLGGVTSRPQSVVGIHFFNPVPVFKLVELVPSIVTDPEVTERARTFVEGTLGKSAIDCQDRAGFVVNALLVPFILSAIRMLESGFATAEDIDRGLVLGAARSEEHTSELQSLVRISYAVFCLKKKKITHNKET